ncbi:MAG: hypothetical protein QXE69_07850 [Nitrososphaerota archaeon]
MAPAGDTQADDIQTMFRGCSDAPPEEFRSHLIRGRGMVSLPWVYSIRAPWRRFDGEAPSPVGGDR